MPWDFTLIFRWFSGSQDPTVQPWLHSVVGLHRPAAVGMLVATERGQQRGAQRDEEDHEEGARGLPLTGTNRKRRFKDALAGNMSLYYT